MAQANERIYFQMNTGYRKLEEFTSPSKPKPVRALLALDVYTQQLMTQLKEFVAREGEDPNSVLFMERKVNVACASVPKEIAIKILKLDSLQRQNVFPTVEAILSNEQMNRSAFGIINI